MKREGHCYYYSRRFLNFNVLAILLASFGKRFYGMAASKEGEKMITKQRKEFFSIYGVLYVYVFID